MVTSKERRWGTIRINLDGRATAITVTLWPIRGCVWAWKSSGARSTQRGMPCTDAENIYDELKNQWGWNGFTTQKLARCRLMANLVALIYNWWHLYVRLYVGDHHREAITSRPALLSGVARLAVHQNQRKIRVSLQHENSQELAQAIAQVSNT